MAGVEVTTFLKAYLLSGYFKRYPGKSKARTWGGNPKLRSFLNVQTLDVSRVVTVKCPGSDSK